MSERSYSPEEVARIVRRAQMRGQDTAGSTALAEALRSEGRSVRWLAGRLDLDPMNVSRWATGKKPVPEKHKAKIARLLRRTKTELFGRARQKRPA